MKALQVSFSSLTGNYRCKAEGVPTITRGKHTLNEANPALDIATQLCNKYDWLQAGKFRLEEGCLDDDTTVFVFVKNSTQFLYIYRWSTGYEKHAVISAKSREDADTVFEATMFSLPYDVVVFEESAIAGDTSELIYTA